MWLLYCKIGIKKRKFILKIVGCLKSPGEVPCEVIVYGANWYVKPCVILEVPVELACAYSYSSKHFPVFMEH